MDVVWSALIPAVSALVGAWFGARIALDRFKKEHTFDRRVDWHVGALRVIHDLELAHRRLKLHELDRPPEYAAMRENFDRIIGEAPAYMTDLRWRDLRLTKEELWLKEQTTRELVRSGENWEARADANWAEHKVIQEAEKVVIQALNKLMPPDPDYRWPSRIKARLLRFRRKRAS